MNEKALTKSLIVYWDNVFCSRSYNIASGMVKSRAQRELYHLFNWSHGGWSPEKIMETAGFCSKTLDQMAEEVNLLSDMAVKEEKSEETLRKIQGIVADMKNIRGLIEALNG